MDNRSTLEALPNHLPNLTPLRALAALAVVFFHKLTIYSTIDPDNGGWERWVDIVLNKGHLGVNFFFTLSGFLITYLLIKEKLTKGRIHVGNFMMRRVLRIWPVYFLVVGFGFLIFPHLSDMYMPQQPGLFVSFLSNFDEIQTGLFSSTHHLTALWSISVEEQFYVCWAIILGLLSLDPKKHYPFLFGAILVGSLVFRWTHIDDERVLYYHTLSVMSDMALGGALAYVFVFRQRLMKRLAGLSRLWIILLYLGGGLFILAHNKIMQNELYVFDRVLTGLFWCFIIWEQTSARHSLIKVGRFKWLEYLGKISYGLYAYHLIVFFFVNDYLWPEVWAGSRTMDIGVNTAVVLAGTILTAGLSYQYIERPLLRLKARFSS